MILAAATALALMAAAIVALSAYGVTYPGKFVSWVRRLMEKGGVGLAVGSRVVLAALLWITAPVSHTPGAFLVLAALVLVAAIVLAMAGTGRLLRLAERLASWPECLLRLVCVLGLVFGGFLLWSVSAVWTVA